MASAPYVVHVATLAATPLLVVRRRAAARELSRVVPEACGLVWNAARRLGIRSAGRHVAVYLNGNIDCEIGVEVGADASSVAGEEVTLSATPAGTVATAAHIGPYSSLKGAHDAILQWCGAQHRRLAGPSWEIYGHWTDDETKLRTDVFYLIEEKP